MVVLGSLGFTAIAWARPSESFSALQHTIDNHDIEIHSLQERLNTQETLLDALRQQLLDTQFSNKELTKGHTVSLEKKLLAVDNKTMRMGEELRELQAHANDTAKALSDYKQKIVELEKKMQIIHEAMDSVLAALHIDEPKPAETGKVYVVQNGDSLQKIAKKMNIPLKKLKAANQLENDRIYPGQKLKLP